MIRRNIAALAFLAAAFVAVNLAGCSQPVKEPDKGPDDGKVPLTLSLIRKLKLSEKDLEKIQLFTTPKFTLKKSSTTVDRGNNKSAGVEKAVDTHHIEFDDRTPVIVDECRIYPESSGGTHYISVKFGQGELDRMMFVCEGDDRFCLSDHHTQVTEGVTNLSICLLVDLKETENEYRRKANGMTVKAFGDK